MSEVILGIDLGTTNSEVSIIKNSKPEIIKIDGEDLLPSVVSLDNDDNIIVGTSAKNQRLLFPEKTISSVKRKMGELEKLKLGDKEYSPEEISSFILKKLKSAAEKHIGHEVKKAVITVPAYFSDAQKKATRKAGELAGLKVERIINEPTAAALAYEANHKGEKNIVVYDLGGGTFDVSIITLEEGVIEVKSSTGNNHLGGDDFDNLLYNHVLNKIETEHKVKLDDDLKVKNRLLKAVEECKKTLSFDSYATISEEYLFEKDKVPVNVNIEISRIEFEELIEDLVDKTFEAVEQALVESKFKPNDIDEILLVGGSSRIPVITSKMKELFSITPRKDLSPELCVALGAGIQGAIISGIDIGVILIDITPYTFGTSALKDDMGFTETYVPIIYKNSSLPAKGSKVFYTITNNQKSIKITIFQGEDPDPKKNILIGKGLMTGLAEVPAPNEIVFTFHIDLNGLLHCIAEEKVTGFKKELKIENAFEIASENEKPHIEKEVLDLEKNDYYDDDDEEDYLDIEDDDDDDDDKTIDNVEYYENEDTLNIDGKAKELLDRAKKVLNDINENDKKVLNEKIDKLIEASNSNDEKKIDKLINEIEDILFYLE